MRPRRTTSTASQASICQQQFKPRKIMSSKKITLFGAAIVAIAIAAGAFYAGRASVIHEVQGKLHRLSASPDYPSHQCEQVLK